MDHTTSIDVTRGRGLLEPMLARLRARRADALIPPALRQGRILDIGCGTYPYFLAHTAFAAKFGIDQLPSDRDPPDITRYTLNLNAGAPLPFPDGYFSAVTMLAVIEHLDPDRLVGLLRETRRVLMSGRILVLTTPASWAAPLLRVLARASLVSREEIDDHVRTYSLRLLHRYLAEAGFAQDGLRMGTFELGLNLWASARA